jgi:hypothetical protein
MQVLKMTLILTFMFLVLAFFAAATPPAAACMPADGFTAKCIDRNILRQLTPTLAPTATPGLRGDSPDHALDITGNWTTIEPGASVWYKTPNSDGYRVIDLWLDTTAPNALGLSLFSPDQADGLSVNTKPIGRGSFNKGEPSHALTWIAGYAKAGVWYALVQNFSNAPVSYSLGGNLSSTDAKLCHGYWETLRGQPIYWVDCNPLHNSP